MPKADLAHLEEARSPSLPGNQLFFDSLDKVTPRFSGADEGKGSRGCQSGQFWFGGSVRKRMLTIGRV